MSRSTIILVIILVLIGGTIIVYSIIGIQPNNQTPAVSPIEPAAQQSTQPNAQTVQ
jgi:hypothetical protein